MLQQAASRLLLAAGRRILKATPRPAFLDQPPPDETLSCERFFATLVERLLFGQLLPALRGEFRPQMRRQTQKRAKNGLPNAQGSTLVVFKEKPAPESRKRDPLDWPMWRGPEQNGISRETGLIDKFNEASGENVLWRNEEAGGISTPVIMNGRLYTIVRHEPETRREQEKVLCLDAETGEKLWESRHNVYLSGVPAERVGWSCVAADPETDRVYAQGVNGYFQCLDGATGKEIWSRSMHEEFGLLSTYGGRTNTPVVFEDMIIVHSVVVGWGEVATPAHRFIAMDKNTGEVRWFNGTGLRPEDTTFAHTGRDGAWR